MADALPQKLVQALLEQRTGMKARYTKETVAMSGEFLRLFLHEALERAELVRQQDPLRPAEIQPLHIEKILPQLLLDFL